MTQLTIDVQTASILAFALELLLKANIIKLPEGAKYTLQDILNVILYAAVSVCNSTETANKGLKAKNLNKKVP
jgi:hypothetical protein